MRKILGTFFIVVSLSTYSCKKELHRLRFINNYPLPITEVKVGNTTVGDLASGQASSYQNISAGTQVISGNCSAGFLEGSVYIAGKGDHMWTLNLNEDKTITLVQDK